MNDIAIKIEHLSKYYNLGVIHTGTLNRDVQSWIYTKILRREDPNRQIGYKEDTKDGFWALKDVNLEINKSERVGIIGRNGAGKSTLLKMISQISAPTEGKIYLNGTVASLLEVGTGFNPELTGRENVFLNGTILGLKKSQIESQMDEIIAFSEIERYRDTPVKRYSSGMYIRLAFAVAAHLESEILISDEVLAVGDVRFQKKALAKMNSLSMDEGRTVLFVSHSMDAIRRLCTKGVVMEKGSLLRYDEDINDSINYYLEENIVQTSNRNVLYWANDGSRGNGYFKPNALSLKTDGEKIDGTKPVLIEIDCTVEEESKDLYFELCFISVDNRNIVFTASPFFDKKDFMLKKGNHKLLCTVPANFFNTKDYQVELRANIFKKSEILATGTTAPSLFFTVDKKQNSCRFERSPFENCAPLSHWDAD